MKIEKLKELYSKYGLEKSDVYKHKHYTIITRDGIEKIQAKEGMIIRYEPIVTSVNYWAIRATGTDSKNNCIETFGSAVYGGKEWNKDTNKWIEHGNTTSWYIAEIAEKRAMSRVVLKLTGLYAYGFLGEDESEDFDKTKNKLNYPVKQVEEKEELTPNHKRWEAAKKAFSEGKKEAVLKHYKISEDNLKLLML